MRESQKQKSAGEQTRRQSTIHRSLRLSEIEHVASNIEAFCQATAWIQTYLARPHKMLGRSGTVCPFAQSALAQDSIHIAVVRLSATNKRARMVDAISYHLQAFLSKAASATDNERILQATLVIFPDVSLAEAVDLIDRTKEELKPDFIRQGLMLGEFHARNESGGLHNPEFRPLRSPLPMLAIRHMVPTDLVFLNRPEYDIQTRLQYLDAYLAVPSIPQSYREEVERLASGLRTELHHYRPPAILAQRNPA
jgi:hypothetical protein